MEDGLNADGPGGVDGILGALLRVAHEMEPDALPEAVASAAARLGAAAALILLADYDQAELRPLLPPRAEASAPASIDGTLAGRVFRTLTPVETDDADGRRILVPLVDGSHRIGVLELRVPATSSVRSTTWHDLAALVAELVITKSAYGDTLEVARRRKSVAVRSEAQRAVLPPLTLSSPRVLITGMLMPAYEVAGDLFDYALNGDTLHFGIFDAMGHSLGASLTASVAVAGYRNARRGGGGLLEAHRISDAAIAAEFSGERFCTALFAELDLQRGELRTISAGHPSGLVVRDNRVVAPCAGDPALPLGLGGAPPDVSRTMLQPGDRILLFTDGIVEARSDDGEEFGEEQLVDGIARELDSGLPAAEAVRRLVRSVIAHQGGGLADDATLLLVEWSGRNPDDPASKVG